MPVKIPLERVGNKQVTQTSRPWTEVHCAISTHRTKFGAQLTPGLALGAGIGQSEAPVQPVLGGAACFPLSPGIRLAARVLRDRHEHSMRLTCLGTGDGWPDAERGHSAFLYQFATQTVLVDCGEPACRSLKRAGLGPDAVDRVVLSHLHFDHIGGFFMLLQGFWLEGRRKGLDVHLPAEGIKPLRQMLAAGYLFDDLLGFRLRFHALRAEEPAEWGGVRFTAYRTSHLDGLRATFGERHRTDFDAFSFTLGYNGLIVSHTADVGRVSDLAPLLQARSDLLVCELAHVPIAELATGIRSSGVGQVVFVHVGREYRADLNRTVEELQNGLAEIPFRIARDGEVITLPEPAPAGAGSARVSSGG